MGKSIRLIALTGYGQPEDRDRAFDAGFDLHLVKPVDRDQLAGAINGVTPAAADDDSFGRWSPATRAATAMGRAITFARYKRENAAEARMRRLRWSRAARC